LQTAAPIQATGGVTPVAALYQNSVGATSLWRNCSCPRIPRNAREIVAELPATVPCYPRLAGTSVRAAP